MKTVEFVVILFLSIHYASTSNLKLVYNEGVVDAIAETEEKPLVFTSDVETLDLDTSDFGVEIWEPSQIFLGECSAHCRRLGHARGDFIDNFCQCRLRDSTVAELKKGEQINSESRLGCTLLSCLDICTRLGFRYFKCEKGRCTCWR